MSLFRNPKKATILIYLFLVVCIAAWATTCSAQSMEPGTYTSFGYGRTVLRGQTDVLELSHTWRVNNMKDAQWRIGMTLIGSSDDARYQREVRNNYCLSGQYLDGFADLKVGLGIAACQNRNVYLSSNTSFDITIEWHFHRRAYLKFGHKSNAGSVPPNSGMDYLMLMGKFY